MKKSPGLTIAQLVTAITFLAIFAMAAKPSIDSDTWWHLRAGQWIIEQQAVPQVDPFSYTRLGQPWHYPGWLVEVPMTWLYQTFGPLGLNLWTASMVTLAFWLVGKTLGGGPFLRAFTLVLAAAASGVYWAARPYLVTFVLAAAFLWILDGARWHPDNPARQRRVWGLPPLMVVWANSHGGFALGFLLLGVYGFGELMRLAGVHLAHNHPLRRADFAPLVRLVGVGLALLLAVCLNPSGPQMLGYAFKTVSIGALQDYILEWQSPNFHLLAAHPTIWLIGLLLAALGLSRRRLALTDFLLAFGFLYLALLAWRNVALFALAAPPVITRHLAPPLAALGRRWCYRGVGAPTPAQTRLNGLLLVVLILVMGLKVTADALPAANEKALRAFTPVAAVDYIRQNRPPGRLFNAYNWGAYLLWALPEYPVFIDGRTDLYNDEIIDQWLQVTRAEPGWQTVLDRWQVRLVLLEPGAPVVGLLQAQGWQTLYQDEQAVVLGR